MLQKLALGVRRAAAIIGTQIIHIRALVVHAARFPMRCRGGWGGACARMPQVLGCCGSTVHSLNKVKGQFFVRVTARLVDAHSAVVPGAWWCHS